MTEILSTQDSLQILIAGLKLRNIDFTISHDAFNCQLTEIFINEAQNLIILLNDVMNQDIIRRILEARIPLRVRLTIFTNNAPEFRKQVIHLVTKLRQQGLFFPNIEQAISIQEMSTQNLTRLLDTIKNWDNQRKNGKVQAQHFSGQHQIISDATHEGNFSNLASQQSLLQKKRVCIDGISNNQRGVSGAKQDLNLQIQNAIKTYWTEKYFARRLNISQEEVREVANHIGISREICGQEILYFLNRTVALNKYFSHILRAILEELNLRFQKKSNQIFFIPDLHLAIIFFDGNKENITISIEDFTGITHLIVVVPEELRKQVRKIKNDLVQIIPLARERIFNALNLLMQQHVVKVTPFSPMVRCKD